MRCLGDWTASRLAPIERQLRRLTVPPGPWQLDATGVERLDTAGALLLQRLCQRLEQQGEARLLLTAEQRALFELIGRAGERRRPAAAPRLGAVARLGRATVLALSHFYALLSFLGEATADALPRLLRPHTLRWRQVTAELQRAGVDALPIVALLAFLMGVVIAYQSGGPLQDYGANLYLVDLLSITMLREMAPLVTAIVVAGRTGSAYAAQLGTMNITEEIDALRTLGITPFEMLVLPKMLALAVALPLLTVLADVLGVFGGMLVADALFGVGFQDFLRRLPQALQHSTYWVGVAKAPVFALIIAAVGCFNGFRVRGSAEDVGRATTSSVVQSIFLVIVADAVFSILFNWLNL